MSTQEERRQAIGKANTAERQAIGQRMIDERRGAGQRIRDDLNRSVMPERKQKTLPELPAKGALSVSVGVGVWQGVGAAPGGGGIASPLTEPDVATREYWSGGLTSSDGLFVLPAIKALNLTDANGAAVQIQLANPAGSA